MGAYALQSLRIPEPCLTATHGLPPDVLRLVLPFLQACLLSEGALGYVLDAFIRIDLTFRLYPVKLDLRLVMIYSC